jgi:PAS domain S-box-containing protein
MTYQDDQPPHNRSQAHENELRLILNATPALLAYIDADLRIKWVNQEFERWFGQPSEAIQGRNLRQVLGEASWQEIWPFVRRTLAGEVVTFERLLPPQVSAARWVRVTNSPDRGLHGQVQGFIAHAVDITEWKKIEEALRASEERFRSLFEGHRAVMLLIEPDSGQIVDANAAAAVFYGYPRERLRAMRIDEINQLPPEEVAARRQQAVALVKNQFIFPHRLADGQLRWVEVYSSPVTIEGRPMLFSIIHDITARRQAEAALRESEAKFRSAFANAAIGFAMMKPDGSFVDANPAFCRLVGYDIADLREMTYQQLAHPDDISDNLQLVEQMLAGKINDYVIENRYVRQDGKAVWVRKSVSVDRDAEGQLRWIIALIEDITERKQAEAAQVVHTELLLRSNQALEDFATIASHDLLEPLRKVRAFGKLLRSRFGQELGDQGQDYIERIQQAASRMQGMLDGLLAYARVTSQGQGFIQVDLQQILVGVLSDLEARIMQTGGQVSAESLPLIEADPFQMRQLFQNLLGNGLKFHRPSVPPEIRVSGRQAGDNLIELDFTDNGIGIDPSKVEVIFQPFHRLHNQTEFEGSGIGLAICRKIVECHSGSIVVISQPGQGTTFRVRLPICQESRASSALAPAEEG